jgi:peptidyl-prolyl cis-trans isomerase C
MFKPLICISLLFGILLGHLPSYAANSTDPIVVVNDETITHQDYENYVKARLKQTGDNENPDKKILVEELIQRELLRQAALRELLYKQPEFIQKLEYMRNNLLIAMAMHHYLESHPIGDALLKEEYKRQLTYFKGSKEYKVRHILMETEAEAKAIIAALEKGKSFAKLATEKSLDKSSAKNNGELGWIVKSTVVPSFGIAVEALEKSKYTTTPVKSRYGWHVIQLDDIRKLSPPSFESVKERIKTLLQERQIQKYVAELREQAKVEVFNKP